MWELRRRWVWGVCVPHEDVRCPSLSLFYLTPLRQELSLNLELGWQLASLSDPPVSTLHRPGL